MNLPGNCVKRFDQPTHKLFSICNKLRDEKGKRSVIANSGSIPRLQCCLSAVSVINEALRC